MNDTRKLFIEGIEVLVQFPLNMSISTEAGTQASTLSTIPRMRLPRELDWVLGNYKGGFTVSFESVEWGFTLSNCCVSSYEEAFHSARYKYLENVLIQGYRKYIYPYKPITTTNIEME